MTSAKEKERVMRVFNDGRKYLFAAALLVLIAFCGYFYYAFGELESTLIREKEWEKSQDLELLCAIIEQMADMNEEMNERAYEATLLRAVQHIEANYNMTFAQIYDENMVPMVELHQGISGGQKHNPLAYSEFVEAVTVNESGKLVYWYETEQAGGRYIHLNYRWIEGNGENGSRYLVVIGISKYTIKESINDVVIYGAIALIVVAAVFIVGAVMALCQLGYVYSCREGETWRARKYS